MLLAILRTHIVEHRDGPLEGEGGYYEIEVHVNETELELSGDVKGYCNLMISSTLAYAVRETTVPPNLWTVTYEDHPRKKFNLPEYLDFNVGRVQ